MKIILKKKALLHDIDQWTYRLAQVHITDDRIRNDAQADESVSTDASFYTRSITNALADIKACMGPRIEKVTCDATDDLSLSAEWTITTARDDEYATDAQTLADLIHHYIVVHVIKHWCAIYKPDEFSLIEQESLELMSNIKLNLYLLSAPVKHRRPAYHEEVKISISHE